MFFLILGKTENISIHFTGLYVNNNCIKKNRQGRNVFNMFTGIMNFTQFIITIIVGIYFLTQLTGQADSKSGISAESKTELERLNYMRRNHLTKPLTEETRPSRLDEIIGQEDGVKALTIALGGDNPQHILIYGPPGVGKTAAARVALEYVKHSGHTVFAADAPFIEIDATTMHYDERSIADPLIGSVHDPIYQGAGAYGNLGAPQIKEGAVSRAHGGVLFVDEIGELCSVQLNRLLKVLEDRCVMFSSSYYSKNNKNIPRHVHDVFKNGMPADFRLIGATTRRPDEIPDAVRSRCVEIFFRPLNEKDLKKIAFGAVSKLKVNISDEICSMVARISKNGRDCVKIISMISSKVLFEGRDTAVPEDVLWIVKTGHFTDIKYMFSSDDNVVNYGTGR